jgi:hypothetical protein
LSEEEQQYKVLLAQDLIKLKAEHEKGPASFLCFINEEYVPAEKKIDLTDEMLAEDQLKRTMVVKFSVIFHPDKNVNE